MELSMGFSSWGFRHHFMCQLYHLCVLPAGYDMEDAMILNKSSVERGFAHAYLYKTEQIDLREDRGK